MKRFVSKFIYFVTPAQDIARTFPGHQIIDSFEGQEKLKRVLEVFARRNKAVGYCQSMNFLAAWLLINFNMDEEDSFWVLTCIVEDICSGIWSRSMLNIQIDSCVLGDLVRDKLPSVNSHIEKLNLSLLLVTTKWFMCIFLSYLPSEVNFIEKKVSDSFRLVYDYGTTF